MDGTTTAGRGRRRESLAARQARVGIIANPQMPKLPRPIPREVWTRWPDLRAAKRRSQGADAGGQDGSDLLSLDAFVQSVRRSGPAPNRAPANATTAEDGRAAQSDHRCGACRAVKKTAATRLEPKGADRTPELQDGGSTGASWLLVLLMRLGIGATALFALFYSWRVLWAIP